MGIAVVQVVARERGGGPGLRPSTSVMPLKVAQGRPHTNFRGANFFKDIEGL